jgi:hypothetical protein
MLLEFYLQKKMVKKKKKFSGIEIIFFFFFSDAGMTFKRETNEKKEVKKNIKNI